MRGLAEAILSGTGQKPQQEAKTSIATGDAQVAHGFGKQGDSRADTARGSARTSEQLITASDSLQEKDLPPTQTREALKPPPSKHNVFPKSSFFFFPPEPPGLQLQGKDPEKSCAFPPRPPGRRD